MKKKGKVELDLEEYLNQLESRVEEAKPFDKTEHDTKTRSHIANRFVSWFFYLLGGSILAILIYNSIIIYNDKPGDYVVSFKDVILTIGTVVGSPLGFVVGYYFKEDGRNNKK